MRPDYSNAFRKRYKKLPFSIQLRFEDRLQIFKSDKFHPLLNNHALTGGWQGHRSINITGDWRAIFREFENGELIYFDIIGTHSELYGN